MAAPAIVNTSAPHFAPCTCVALHGLSAAALNGALGVVEPPSAPAAPGRVPIRVVSPRDVALSHSALAIKPVNLRPCTADELAFLHVDPLLAHVQNELNAASVALQAAEGDASKADAALARLRTCEAHAEAACAYVEAADNVLPDGYEGTAREGLVAVYAFFSGMASANVAATCAARGDTAGQLAVLTRAFAKALQNPRVPAVASRFGQHGFVQDVCLRFGEALRCAGRSRDALPPLRWAARVAAVEGDTSTEAAARGTLSCVLLSLSDYEAADVAGEREVALLLAARPRTAPLALALARAQAGLGNVKHALATAAVHGSPTAAALAASAEQLAEAAIAAVPRSCSGAEAGQWAEVACGVHALRGHILRFRDDLEGAVRHFEAALEVAAHGLGDPAAAPRPPLPTDAAVTPHCQLERVHGQLATRARERGAADEARAHGQKAVHHRLQLFRLVGKPLPNECCICADTLAAEEPDSDVALLPCLHAFHTRCIDEWLTGKCKGTCPLCREWSVVAAREDVEAYQETMQALGHGALD